MSDNTFKPHWQQQAAQDTLDDVLHLLNTTQQASSGGSEAAGQPMDSSVLVNLLERNFARIDLNGDGISRAELAAALARPGEFTQDEYVMLKLLAQYFATVADLSDDEPGPETRITRNDKNALKQSLLEKKVTLGELHRWSAMQSSADLLAPPPPLTQGD